MSLERSLYHIVNDLQTQPIPVNHINDKISLGTAANLSLIKDEDYDLNWIIGNIYNELALLINNEEQVAENEMVKLAKELELLNTSLEEYWLGVDYGDKDNDIKETRIILLDMLTEIKNISDNLIE